MLQHVDCLFHEPHFHLSLSFFHLIFVYVLGFTGERVCLYLAKYLSSNNAKQREGNKQRSVCLAGRSEKKLLEIGEKMKQIAQKEQQQQAAQTFKISVLTASVEDEPSLLSMTQNSKVIIDCVGPVRYTFKQNQQDLWSIVSVSSQLSDDLMF